MYVITDCINSFKSIHGVSLSNAPFIHVASKCLTKCWSLPENENDSQKKSQDVDRRIDSSKEENTLGALLKNTDLLEVRLDATLCAIFVMGRFLLYDMTLPPKQVPGLETTDVVAVLDTFSSAGALAILWSISGIGVGLFDTSSDASNNNDLGLLTRLFGTTALSVPLWILIEKLCHWPISAGLDGSSLPEAMLLSSLGVLGTMLIGRTMSRFLP